MFNYLKQKQYFWNTAKFVAKFYPTFLLRKLPREIIMELTNSCNLRCPVCSTHFAMKRKRGLMSLDLFKSVIDEFKGIKEKPQISMDFAGEPLVNSKAYDFVEYATKNGHKTFISTNCTFLSKDMSTKLIKAGLSSIHLCIDGFTKKSHEAYRINSDFIQVKKSIEDFVKIRNDLGMKTPHISLQTLITSFSENEIKSIINWARDIGADEINLKSFSLGSYTSKKMKEENEYFLPSNKKYRRKTFNVYKTVCTAPSKIAVVFWNGDLGLCCVDFDNALKLPNISERGFIKTYTSKKMTNIKRSALVKKFGICKKCTIGNADFLGFDVDLRKKRTKK